jgi:N-acetylglutamate synthase-like GNAT family acetyltransferase
MNILKASSSDITSISQTLKLLDTQHYTFSDPAGIQESISKNLCWVSRAGAEVEGALVAREVEGSIEIYALAVRPGSQRSGIGAQLLAAAEAEAQQRGMEKMWCWSLVRYSASEFYLRNGFQEMYLLERQFYGEDCWFCGKQIGYGQTKSASHLLRG